MKNEHNGSIFLGIFLVVTSFFGLITNNGGRLWGVDILPWINWFLLPLGAVITVFGVIGKKRQVPIPPKTYTQDDIAQAKAWFDATVSNNADEETRKNIAKIDEVMDLSKSTDNGVAMKLEQQPGADVQQTGRQV